MKNLFWTSYYFTLIAMGILLVCNKSKDDVPKENTIEKSNAQTPFDNHQINEVFDPCKWVWGSYFVVQEKLDPEPYKYYVNKIVEVHSRKTLLLKQSKLIDSIVVFYYGINQENRGKIIDSLIVFSSKMIQVIKPHATGFYNWDNDVVFGHYNNDNYLDFRLYDFGSGTMGSIYQVFLYNPNNRLFEKNDALWEPSLSYDRVHDIYQSWSRGGACYFSAERFILKNGTKKVLKAIEVGWISIGDTAFLERKFIVGKDTLIRVYDSNDIKDYCDNVYKIDKYCKEFLAFKLEYRLR